MEKAKPLGGGVAIAMSFVLLQGDVSDMISYAKHGLGRSGFSSRRVHENALS
jgi:hypothetical protein